MSTYTGRLELTWTNKAIVEQGGPSLFQLLEEHERSNLRGSGFKDWLIMERRTQPGRPSGIEGPYERAWRPVLDRVQEAMEGREDIEIDQDDGDA